MATANYSLSSLKIGDVGASGGMGTALTEFDDPVRGTAVITMEDGTTQDFFGEISDNPYFSAVTPGKVTFAADFYAKSAAQLQKVFGGTVTAEAGGNPARWGAPASQVTLEQSIELTHKNGSKVQMVRVSVNATFEWNFKRDALPIIHFKGTVLQPANPSTGEYLTIPPIQFIEQPLT
ncbi:MAG: hypothetical protein ACTHLB_05480 [Parafilimonas sp.]